MGIFDKLKAAWMDFPANIPTVVTHELSAAPTQTQAYPDPYPLFHIPASDGLTQNAWVRGVVIPSTRVRLSVSKFSFELWLPHLVVIGRGTSLDFEVVGVPELPTSLDTPCYFVPLPHVWPTGRSCSWMRGGPHSDHNPETRLLTNFNTFLASPHQHFDVATSQYRVLPKEFQSVFRGSLIYLPGYLMPRCNEVLAAWSRLTQAQVLALQWNPPINPSTRRYYEASLTLDRFLHGFYYTVKPEHLLRPPWEGEVEYERT